MLLVWDVSDITVVWFHSLTSLAEIFCSGIYCPRALNQISVRHFAEGRALTIWIEKEIVMRLK